MNLGGIPAFTAFWGEADLFAEGEGILLTDRFLFLTEKRFIALTSFMFKPV
jgi:hypothetical protein